MNQLNQFKGIAPYAAGVACILYAVIGLVGNPSFLTAVICVALVAMGLSAMIEKAEIVGVISLAVISVFTLFSFIANVFSIFQFLFTNLFDGYFYGEILFKQILWLIPALIELLGRVAMTALAFFYFKKADNKFGKYTKFWYAPAALLLVAALLTVVLSFFNIIGMNFDFSYLFNIVKYLVTDIILVIGFAAFGLTAYLKSEN